MADNWIEDLEKDLKDVLKNTKTPVKNDDNKKNGANMEKKIIK
jgi:hypothetical protein